MNKDNNTAGITSGEWKTKNWASKMACEKLREAFAESLKIHPGANPRNLKNPKYVLDFSKDETLIEELKNEWTWYMQGWQDTISHPDLKLAATLSQKYGSLEWIENRMLQGVEDGAMLTHVYSKVSDLQRQVKELREALDKINNTHEDVGQQGCTWGDTEYDSSSAAYGYNCALKLVKDVASVALQNTKE